MPPRDARNPVTAQRCSQARSKNKTTQPDSDTKSERLRSMMIKKVEKAALRSDFGTSFRVYEPVVTCDDCGVRLSSSALASHLKREHPKRKLTRLTWKFLDPDQKYNLGQVLDHYKRLQESGFQIIIPQRLEQIDRLGPSEIYIGQNEFRGYVVFRFDGKPRVILECPVYGNATYLLGSDWMKLSHFGKTELCTEFRYRRRGLWGRDMCSLFILVFCFGFR